MAQGHCKRDELWILFSLEEMKYLIFSFLRSRVEASRGVKFRFSSHNESRISEKLGTDLLILIGVS